MDAKKVKFIVENATQINEIVTTSGMKITNWSYNQFVEIRIENSMIKACAKYQSKIIIGDFGNGDCLIVDNCKGEHVVIIPSEEIDKINCSM